MKNKHLKTALGAVPTELGDRPATVAMIRGFLFGIACSPELIQPSEWLEVMTDTGLIALDQCPDPALVVGDLLELYNEVNATRLRAVACMPVGVRFRSDIKSNFGGDATVGQWSFGFIVAHAYLHEVWTGYTPQESEEFVNDTLAILMHFASLDAAAESMGISPDDAAFTAVSEALRSDFPEAIAVFAKLSAVVAQFELGGTDASDDYDTTEGGSRFELLSNYLAQTDGPSLAELRGFLFGLEWAPVEVDSQIWIAAALGGGDVSQATGIREGGVAALLMLQEEVGLYYPLGGALPPGVTDENRPDWARGFARSQAWIQPAWSNYLSAKAVARIHSLTARLESLSSKQSRNDESEFAMLLDQYADVAVDGIDAFMLAQAEASGRHRFGPGVEGQA